MKNLKRFLSFILVSVMVLAMSLPVFAADNTTIIIDGNGKQFFAYRLLEAEELDDGSFHYTLNSKYTGILQTITGEAGTKIIDKIEGMSEAETRTFADAVYAAIESRGLTPDATTTTKRFENIPQGYYLIMENQKADDVTNPDGTTTQDQFSLVMLGTAGKEPKTIKTKESDVVVDKKVKNRNDSTGEESDWQDAADYDLGDDVPFKLEGTINENFRQFQTYYYEFVDTMSPGLTYNNDAKVYVNSEGGADITSYFTITYTVDAAGFTTINIRCNDLKNVPDSVLGNKDKIVVRLSGKLNDKSVIGRDGNPNKVQLIYSNNPRNTDKGKTPEDQVVVFTYKIVVNKVDEDNNPLDKAGFTLYKKDVNGTVTLADHAGRYVLVQEISGTAEFNFNRIDAGDYVLVETTVPAGYNKADDITFTVQATLNTTGNGTGDQLVNLEVVNVTPEDATFNVGVASGTVSTSVVNQKGVELPETGGIGTTLFYIIGAVLALGAGVVLVTRRRVQK